MIGAYPPITAPALTIVLAMMMQNVAKIEWKDYTESIPAFLILIGIPFSYSIADGLALGFISYTIIKAFSGRSRQISWLTYVLAIVLVLYFVFVRSGMG
jgi:adenine/guanine/hypoxanthine permease